MDKFLPIIYVRGFAMVDSEMIDTVATPYMGFNLGSTKVSQSWNGEILRHIFESPLVRLMKDYNYQDIYTAGQEDFSDLPKRPVVICRYYEREWEKVSSDDETVKRKSIKAFAKDLENTILRLRDAYCKQYGIQKSEFKINLVAHSMGGLICRCLLQNPDYSNSSKRCVNKVFTYGTPHNGIDVAGMNVPSWLGFNNLSNFNRKEIKKFLAINGGQTNANSLDNKFPEEHFFSLVGTDSEHYDVAMGASKMLTGKLGDGLVRIENAYVHNAPRAYVHRSHSGQYGIVNSEEGYQNLTRFLFGDIRTSARLVIDNLPLSKELKKAKSKGKKIKGSYYFEVSVSTRGSRYYLDQRAISHQSAIFRTYDEMFKPAANSVARMPTLFSISLDSNRIAKGGKEVVFAVDLRVTTTDFEVDGLFWDKNLPDRRLFNDRLVIQLPKKISKDTQATHAIKAKWEQSMEEEKEISLVNGTYSIPLKSQSSGMSGRLEFQVGPA